MSTSSDTFEDQLRQQLRTTTPGPYAGLDPSAVIGAGERVVRRRRLGTALVAAVVVAAVAVGASMLSGGRPLSAPVPAAPSLRTSGPGMAHLTIAQNGGVERRYTVTLLPDPDKPNGLRDTWTLDGSDGSVGGGVEVGSKRATWGFGGDSPFVLGLVPDEAARSVSLSTTADFGVAASTVEPIPGTGWSAFALAFEKPITGVDPFGPILWFDHLGRPVDGDGDVGDVTRIRGLQVSLTHDGTALGVDDGSGSRYSPLPGTTSFGSQGAFPRVTWSRGTTGTPSTIALRLPPAAMKATLVLRDGRRIPVAPVPLGAWRVAVSPTIEGAAPPELVRVEWTDGQGVAHVDSSVG